MSSGLFLVTRSHGPGWDSRRALEQQDQWQEHAAFMEALAEDGFVVLGGPILETTDALLVVIATDEADIEARLAPDPWTRSGHLCITKVQAWQLRLGSLPRQ